MQSLEVAITFASALVIFSMQHFPTQKLGMYEGGLLMIVTTR